MTIEFRNLVFEGGGVKGLAYVGAMQILDQRGHLSGIKRVGGTSAGAINALIFALGYSIQEQRELLESTDFNEFLDDSSGIIRDALRLSNEFGWNKGDFFLNWVDNKIEEKLGKKKATFQDLIDAGKPELYITGTNLSTGYTEFFSAERHPTMVIADALRISMSMPFYFVPIRHGTDTRKDLYVDGGVILNYPVKIFDRERYIDMKNESEAARSTEYYNRENAMFLLNDPDRSPYTYNCQTLGLRLDTTREIGLFRYGRISPTIEAEINAEKKIKEVEEVKKIDDIFSFASTLISAMRSVQENQHLHSDDWERTMYINTLDVKTEDFDISEDKKLALIAEGIVGAEKYFQWFEDNNQPSVNKIN